MKHGGKLFDFNSIENSTLEKLISKLSSQSSPGVSSIQAKVIKSASKTLAPIFTKLFNLCFVQNMMPDE